MPNLSDVAEINPRLDRAQCFDDNMSVSFVPMASVSEASGSIVRHEARPMSEVLKGFTPFQDRDVIVAKITPCFENGKIAHARIETPVGFGSTEFHVVRAHRDQLDDRYLFHFLRQPSIRLAGERRMTGSAGQRRVPASFLEHLDIPLPPLPEQRRIAAILDKADTLSNRRREAIGKLKNLLQSVFLDMFGDPVTNRKGWSKAVFGDLIKVKSGEGLTAQNMNPNGTHLVYGGNGVSGRHDQFMFKEPQIVIGRVGAYCGVVHRTEPESWITDNALYVSSMLRPMNQTFLQAILTAANFNQYAGRAAQPLVSGSRIYPVETIVPPIAAQDEYERRIDAVAVCLSRMVDHDTQLTWLFSSLQSRAFSATL